MIYLILLGSAFLGFLSCLNTLMRGTLTPLFGIGIFFASTALDIAAFVIAGWVYALLSVVIYLAAGFFLVRLAAEVHYRIFSLMGIVPVGKPQHVNRHLMNISNTLAQPVDLNNYMNSCFAGNDPKASSRSALYQYIAQQPRLQRILIEHDMTSTDLDNIYSDLMRSGGGVWSGRHWVGASALAYPECLEFILRRKDEDIKETVSHLRRYFSYDNEGFSLREIADMP